MEEDLVRALVDAKQLAGARVGSSEMTKDAQGVGDVRQHDFTFRTKHPHDDFLVVTAAQVHGVVLDPHVTDATVVRWGRGYLLSVVGQRDGIPLDNAVNGDLKAIALVKGLDPRNPKGDLGGSGGLDGSGGLGGNGIGRGASTHGSGERRVVFDFSKIPTRLFGCTRL